VKRALVAGCIALAGCVPKVQATAEVAAAQIPVPHFVNAAVERPRLERAVRFEEASAASTPLALPSTRPVPGASAPPSPSPTPPPPIYVIGTATGANPSAAVLGGSRPFVYVGDDLDGSTVAKIDVGSVTLADGRVLRVVSAEEIAVTAGGGRSGRPGGPVVPDILPPWSGPAAASSPGEDPPLSPPTTPRAPFSTIEPAAAAGSHPASAPSAPVQTPPLPNLGSLPIIAPGSPERNAP
jgi:hypothetical protein